MEKEVIISIKGTQDYEGQESDGVELITAGTLRREKDDYVLSYEESLDSGMKGTRTEFQISPNRVTLVREGEVRSEMVFERGRRHLSLYETPYGSMAIRVVANKVDAQISDIGGHMDISYLIEIDQQLSGVNQFRIQVREAGIPQ